MGRQKRSIIGQQEGDGESIFSLGFGRQDPISVRATAGGRAELAGDPKINIFTE